MSTRTVWTLAGLLTALALVGCNFPRGGQPTATTTATLALPAPTTQAPPTQPLPASPTAPPAQQDAAPTATLLPTMPATPPTDTPVPSPTALPTDETSGLPPTPGDVLLSDNFDAPNQRWLATAGAADVSGLENGIYYLAVNVPDRWSWRLGPINSAVKDLVVQVDMRLANAAPNGVYGFICRYDNATQSFYNFSLSGDGRFRIARVSNGGEWTFLLDFAEPSGAIKPAAQWNQVEIGCVGSYLWLRANGVLLANLQDTTYANVGDWGFWAQTRGGATQARAEYDNLVIRAAP